MATVLEVINGAAITALIKTAEIALEPDDYQTILDEMNDMLMEWVDIGLTPQYFEVFNDTDVLQVDRNAISAVKANLAVRIAPDFNKVVTAGMASKADSTLRRLEASIVNIGRVAYPDTMPIGSGNECPSIHHRDRFFPANKEKNF